MQFRARDNPTEVELRLLFFELELILKECMI